MNAPPVTLDVTETTIVAQHFDARGGESPLDQGYGSWLNRLNAALSWDHVTAGARLDSSVYWLRPIDGTLPADLAARAPYDEASRYRNAIYPAKLWVTYRESDLEATAGDSYVQFGRGLVLSMRKIDELGIDTTLRGGKLAWQRDPFALTLVAGIANPNRVDEATGRALFFALPPDAQPLYGSDRIVGAAIEAGRGSPLVLGTHAARLTRCAPVRYDASGAAVDGGVLDAPFGSCDPRDTAAWLSSIAAGTSPGARVATASEITTAGQSLAIPDVGGHGQLYVEAAVQKRDHDGANDPLNLGNALYASISADAGPVTETIEIKSYRNFYPLAAAVNVTKASAFDNVTYSTPPTAELITQDAELGYFNACVDGGRARTDVRTSRSFLFYATGAYFHTKTEQAGGACDDAGHTVTGAVTAPQGTADDVEDVVLGEEWTFDEARSHLFASAGARNDTYSATGGSFYRELHAEYAFTKSLYGPYAVELQGRHRFRYEATQNDGAFWNEGESYAALKIAPKWAVTQGFEYTTFAGLPSTYFNGSVLYRITPGDNVKLFVGQQRAGLRCISGVCKLFPAFEGARVEVTLRF